MACFRARITCSVCVGGGERGYATWTLIYDVYIELKWEVARSDIKHNSLLLFSLIYVYRVCYLSFACVSITDEGPGLDQNVWNPLELYMQLASVVSVIATYNCTIIN